jgi:hypothetical protein
MVLDSRPPSRFDWQEVERVYGLHIITIISISPVNQVREFQLPSLTDRGIVALNLPSLRALRHGFTSATITRSASHEQRC